MSSRKEYDDAMDQVMKLSLDMLREEMEVVVADAVAVAKEDNDEAFLVRVSAVLKEMADIALKASIEVLPASKRPN